MVHVAKTPGGPGSIPGQETRFHMPQLRSSRATSESLHATTKTEDLRCYNWGTAQPIIIYNLKKKGKKNYVFFN